MRGRLLLTAVCCRWNLLGYTQEQEGQGEVFALLLSLLTTHTWEGDLLLCDALKAQCEPSSDHCCFLRSKAAGMALTTNTRC